MSTTTQRPTPETDAATLCLDCDDSCVEIYTRNQDGSKYEGDVCRSDKMAKLERERDEALAKLSTVYRWIERNHPDGFIDSQSHVQNLDRVADAWHDKLEAMRDERDEAHAIVSACMSAMPVGNIQTHTPENLAARIGDLASALAAETSENEAMREAIREAWHILDYYRKFAPALADLPEDIWLETVEGKQVLSALAKLQPLIKP